MSEFDDLYQEILLSYAKNPKNFCKLEDAHSVEEGVNSFCGDEIKVFIKAKEGKIEKITFFGEGCIISKASAALMTEVLQGKSLLEAKHWVLSILDYLNGKEPHCSEEEFGDLIALSGVKQFPARIKCATLAWHTCLEALEKIID